MQKTALPIYERVFALAVVGFFAFLMFLSYWLFEKEIEVEKGEPLYVQNPLIEVAVEGNVLKPGVYQVKKGTLVKDVVRQAIPGENASLGRIKPDSKIVRRRKIKIH